MTAQLIENLVVESVCVCINMYSTCDKCDFLFSELHASEFSRKLLFPAESCYRGDGSSEVVFVHSFLSSLISSLSFQLKICNCC